MTMDMAGTVPALLIGAGETLCALPLKSVVETMRPMAIERLQGCPDFVAGLSIIRGVPTPVVPLSALLGAAAGAVRRFVTLRTGERDDGQGVALAVERVFGIRRLDERRLAAAPPLLGGMHPDIVARLGTLDGALLMVLETSRLFPDATPDPRNTAPLPP